jgi:hypothetical protein
MIEANEKHILETLLNKRIIGEKHTAADNAVKCLPKDIRGDGKKALKKLIRDGYILPKTTSYGLEVSLNPRRIQEIIALTKP